MVLLAVWLPVTKHCMLEAAGILDLASQAASESGCCVDSEPCADDNCEVVEEGLTATSGASVKVSAAQLLAAVDFLCVPPSADRVEPGISPQFSGALERPLAWVPAWHFERRMVQPSRAPSIISA
jgi:hypothetical protein